MEKYDPLISRSTKVTAALPNVSKPIDDLLSKDSYIVQECTNKALLINSTSNVTISLFGKRFHIVDQNKDNLCWYNDYFGQCGNSNVLIELEAGEDYGVAILNNPKLFEKILSHCNKVNRVPLNDSNFYCTGESGEIILYQQDDELDAPRGYFIIIVNDNFFIVSKEESTEDRYTVSRLCRTIRLLESYNEGEIHLHASAIEKDGKAYIFLGDKGTGKTTAMLYLLKRIFANFISNDHTIVNSDGLIFGPPYSAGIRYGTLQYFPELKEYIGEYYISEPLAKDPKKYFHTFELAEIFGRTIKQGIPLGAIILLRKSETCYIRSLEDIGKNIKSVRENLVSTPNEHQSFWNIYLRTVNPLEESEKLGRIFPFYEIGWNPNNQEGSIELFNLFFAERKSIHRESNENNLNRIDLTQGRKLIQKIHDGVKRKGGMEMYQHAFDVMELAGQYYPSNQYIVLLAGLHDALEEFNKNHFTMGQIQEMILETFGESLGEQLLVDLKSLTVQEDEKGHDEIIDEMIENLTLGTREVRIVKVLDRICNLRGMDGFSKSKIKRYLVSTERIVHVCKGSITADLLEVVENLLKIKNISIV